MSKSGAPPVARAKRDAVVKQDGKTKPPSSNPMSPLTPRIWSGMGLPSYLGLLARNRFAIGWRRIPMALVLGGITTSNSLMGGLSRLVYGRRIADTQIKQDPVFIVGHWRSGTTFLHELLCQDERHTYPTTYECFQPRHFLLTEEICCRWFSFMMPKKRLQDDVPMGLRRPQEDEFALFNLGERSSFFTVAFPNRSPQDEEYLDLEGLPPEALEKWKATLRRFLTEITYTRPQRIVLKSPQHTARVKHLLQMFPGARFVYIVRDPQAVYASTMKLWKLMFTTQGFQTPTFAGLEEYVFETFNRMHGAFERARPLIPPSHFAEVKYEDLVADPLAQVERIYGEIGLEEFEPARPAVERYLESMAGYQTNRYTLEPEVRREIAARWGDFIKQHGYRVE